jgi:hypothetical protein
MIFVSPDKRTELLAHPIKITNKSFENVAKFQYFETITLRLGEPG